MPKLTVDWRHDKAWLAKMGIWRIEAFCKANRLPVPKVKIVPRRLWTVNACGFYRPDTEQNRKWLGGEDSDYVAGINICLEECGTPCGPAMSRNWTWPGSTTDREPFGVICHELGHHMDWRSGERKSSYSSEYCEAVMNEAKEPAISGYCPNPAEWFAEIARVFITNADLLRQLRPATHAILLRKFAPVSFPSWIDNLGVNVPERVVKALVNKGARR